MAHAPGAFPQNVPPLLCHSKDWEDAVGCGRREQGRGWWEKEKTEQRVMYVMFPDGPKLLIALKN